MGESEDEKRQPVAGDGGGDGERGERKQAISFSFDSCSYFACIIGLMVVWLCCCCRRIRSSAGTGCGSPSNGCHGHLEVLEGKALAEAEEQAGRTELHVPQNSARLLSNRWADKKYGDGDDDDAKSHDPLASDEVASFTPIRVFADCGAARLGGGGGGDGGDDDGGSSSEHWNNRL